VSDFERAEWKIGATGQAANEARAWRFMLYSGLFGYRVGKIG